MFFFYEDLFFLSFVWFFIVGCSNQSIFLSFQFQNKILGWKRVHVFLTAFGVQKIKLSSGNEQNANDFYLKTSNDFELAIARLKFEKRTCWLSTKCESRNFSQNVKNDRTISGLGFDKFSGSTFLCLFLIDASLLRIFLLFFQKNAQSNLEA